MTPADRIPRRGDRVRIPAGTTVTVDGEPHALHTERVVTVDHAVGGDGYPVVVHWHPYSKRRWAASSETWEWAGPPGAPAMTVTPERAGRPGDGQPLPVPNDHHDIQSQVIADIDSRRQLGIRRYGTPLQPHNGRDALCDAYEEALDLACYLKQAIVERDAQ